MGKSFLPVLLHYLFLGAALFTLALPSLGPVLDHHLAERLPYHDHVFLSATSSKHHVHFYQNSASHVHYRDSNSNARTLTVDNSSEAGVVYLTSSDGLTESGSSLALTGFHTDVAYPASDGNLFLLGVSEGDGLPPEAFVSPPRKPPRV